MPNLRIYPSGFIRCLSSTGFYVQMVSLLFQSLAQRQEFLQPGDDALLLGKRREGNHKASYIFL